MCSRASSVRWSVKPWSSLPAFTRHIGLVLSATLIVHAWIGIMPIQALAKAHLIVVFPLRATPDLATHALRATAALTKKLASFEGFDATQVPHPTTAPLSTQAAQLGAEFYVVGQLTGSATGYTISISSFDVSNDQLVGKAKVDVTSDALVELPDLHNLVASSQPSSSQSIALQSIPVGTLVLVSVINEVSSASAKVGDLVPLQAASDVMIANNIVIPKGALGEAEIAVAEAAGGNGHPGKLGLTYHWITDVNGNRVLLSAIQTTAEEQQNHGAVSTASIVGYVLLGPLGLFVHNWVKGKQVILQPSTKLNSYVAPPLRPVSPPPSMAPSTQPTSVPTSPRP